MWNIWGGAISIFCCVLITRIIMNIQVIWFCVWSFSSRWLGRLWISRFSNATSQIVGINNVLIFFLIFICAWICLEWILTAFWILCLLNGCWILMLEGRCWSLRLLSWLILPIVIQWVLILFVFFPIRIGRPWLIILITILSFFVSWHLLI